MGRPRVVRSAEEQAAFEERRRELTRERARRRRADRAVREREAEALRLRRAADPEMRERQANAKRQRRAADPELREREAERRRQRRLGVYPEKKNNECLSNASVNLPGATAKFQREFLDGNFGASCSVCDRLCFDHDLVLVSGISSNEQRRNVFDVLKEHYPNRDCNQFKICGMCKDSLVRGLLPAFSTVNGWPSEHSVSDGPEKKRIKQEPQYDEDVSWDTNDSVDDRVDGESLSSNQAQAQQHRAEATLENTADTSMASTSASPTGGSQQDAFHFFGMMVADRLRRLPRGPALRALNAMHQVLFEHEAEAGF